MPKKQTYKYNLYKIEKEQESSLRAHLLDRGLLTEGERVYEDYKATFYLCKEPDISDDIWWVRQYGELISNERKAEIKNSSFHAVVLFSSNSSCFAIPLGKAHFYLRDYANSDFGVELATRVADEKNVLMANTRSFGSKKTKSIASYSPDARLDIESGESLEFVKAGTIDRTAWGKNGSFGASASLKLEINLSEISDLLNRIESTMTGPTLFDPSRATPVKSKAIKNELDVELSAAFANGSPSSNLVKIDSIQLHGIEFIFRDIYSFILIGPNRTKSDLIEELDLDTIRTFANTHGIPLADSWQAIKIQSIDSDGKSKFTEPLKRAISFVTIKNDRFYFLNDGQWLEFSQSYVENLLESVQDITVFPTDPALNLSVESFESWKASNPSQRVDYKEYWYNSSILSGGADGILSYDRNSIRPINKYTVEPLDAYDPANQRFIFVKRWKKTADFNYLVDQAITSLKLLLPGNKISVAGNILECKCAQLLLIRSGNELASIQDIKSLIILQKLNAFKAACRSRGIKCEVRFQYEIA